MSALQRAEPTAFVERRALHGARLAHPRTMAARARRGPIAPAPPPNLIAAGDRFRLGARDLAQAVATEQFHLCYQAKLCLKTRRIDSIEALARWSHPRFGNVPPDQFIPVLESGPHLAAFTNWVLRQAMADQRRLAEAGQVVDVSVNISGALLADDDFIELALTVAATHPGKLRLEITETAVIDNPQVAFANLELLVDAGLGISIDDYGSGLSSLAYLRRLPAQELKIDKVFITGMVHSHRDPLLVRSTIDLAHGLGMKVTAEGVETRSTLELLNAMGCDHAQGYIVAHPLPFPALAGLMHDPRALASLTSGGPADGADEDYW